MEKDELQQLHDSLVSFQEQGKEEDMEKVGQVIELVNESMEEKGR